MRIFICLRRHDAMRKARDWFCAKAQYAVYEELITWARARESSWGECFLMLEVDIPGRAGLHARNVDLLMAFSDRVAAVEVKNHRSYKTAKESLAKSLRQCCTTFDLVSAHMAGVVDDSAVRPFLYIPELTSNEISELTAQQLSTSSMTHPTISGGVRSKARPALSNGHPLYLVEAIRSRLGQMAASRSERFTRDAQKTLLGLLNPSEVFEFSTLSSAVESLRRHSNSTRPLHLHDSYVRGLRTEALSEAIDRLDRLGVVEVVGSPGAGKSDFIGEVLETIAIREARDLAIARIDLTGDQPFMGLLHHILTLFDAEPSSYEDAQTLENRLRDQRGFIWVQKHDGRAKQVLQTIVNLLGSAEPRCCRLVIESTARSVLDSGETWRKPSPENPTIQLRRLSVGAIKAILDTRPDLPEVSRMRVLLDQDRTGDLRHVLLPLRPAAQPVVSGAADFQILEAALTGSLDQAVWSFTIFMLDESPIEVDVRILITAARAVFRQHLSTTVGTSVSRVVDVLVRGELVKLQYIDGRRWPILGAQFASTQRGWLTHLNRSLADYVRGRLDETTRLAWREQIQSTLRREFLHRRHVEVLLALWEGDLRPWCGSAFRAGPINTPTMVAWLDRRFSDRQAITEEEASIERSLRLGARFVDTKTALEERKGIQVQAELPKPPSDAHWPNYFYQLFLNLSATLKHGQSEMKSGGTWDLAAESVCWVIQIDGKNYRRAELWPMMRHLTDLNTSPPIRMLVLHHALYWAARCGAELIVDLKRRVADWCSELSRLAMVEGNVFFLSSGIRFHQALIDQHPGVTAALIRSFGRPGSALDDPFWKDAEIRDSD